MTLRAPIVLRDGKLVELPAGDTIGGAPAGADGTNGTNGTDGVDGTSPLSYGVMSTLQETVFAGMSTQTFSSGTDYTLSDGLTYTASYSGSGGGAAVVATGLQMTAPSTASQEVSFRLKAPQTTTLLVAERWRRGRVGFWCRVASCTRGSATGGFWYAPLVSAAAYPKYGAYCRRNYSSTNQIITAGRWFSNAETTGTMFPQTANDTTSDVFLLYYRSPFEIEHYYGTWSGAWPDMAAMTLGAVSRVTVGTDVLYLPNATDSTQFSMGLGGGQTTTNSANIVYDRYRITTWD